MLNPEVFNKIHSADGGTLLMVDNTLLEVVKPKVRLEVIHEPEVTPMRSLLSKPEGESSVLDDSSYRIVITPLTVGIHRIERRKRKDTRTVLLFNGGKTITFKRYQDFEDTRAYKTETYTIGEALKQKKYKSDINVLLKLHQRMCDYTELQCNSAGLHIDIRSAAIA